MNVTIVFKSVTNGEIEKLLQPGGPKYNEKLPGFEVKQKLS